MFDLFFHLSIEFSDFSYYVFNFHNFCLFPVWIFLIFLIISCSSAYSQCFCFVFKYTKHAYFILPIRKFWYLTSYFIVCFWWVLLTVFCFFMRLVIFFLNCELILPSTYFLWKFFEAWVYCVFFHRGFVLPPARYLGTFNKSQTRFSSQDFFGIYFTWIQVSNRVSVGIWLGILGRPLFSCTAESQPKDKYYLHHLVKGFVFILVEIFLTLNSCLFKYKALPPYSWYWAGQYLV